MVDVWGPSWLSPAKVGPTPTNSCIHIHWPTGVYRQHIKAKHRFFFQLVVCFVWNRCSQQIHLLYFPLFNLISNVISLCNPTVVFVRQKYHLSLSLLGLGLPIIYTYLYSTFASITNLILDFSLSLSGLHCLFVSLITFPFLLFFPFSFTSKHTPKKF